MESAPDVEMRPSGLTLGALYHQLRAGIGDAGWAHTSIRFDQHVSESSAGADGSLPGRLTKTSFVAELDFQDGALRRAEMRASRPAPAAPLRVLFAAAADGGFDWSVDGVRWGEFRGPVRLFEINSFEEMLSFVRVEDAVITSRNEPGRSLTRIGVELDRPGFQRLLRAFGADTEEQPEVLDLTSYSMHLIDVGTVALDYWWQLQGDESGDEGPVRVTVNCHVTIGIAPLDEEPRLEHPRASQLPALDHVDDVWGKAREAAAADD